MSLIVKFVEDEATIKARAIGNIPDGWRVEEGDFTRDMVIPIVPEVLQLQINQDVILNNAFASTAAGPYLEEKVAEVGLTRNVATVASGTLTITGSIGVVIPAGHVINTIVLDNEGEPISVTTDLETTFAVDGDLIVAVTTTKTGAIMNVPAGAQWVMYPSIAGISQLTQVDPLQFGQDEESDESLFSRYQIKSTQPVLSGNKAAYISWATERPGVGAAKVLGIWSGPGTVKVLLVDTVGRPVSSAVVTDVQTYIDPNQDAKGDGKAPMGAIATIESAVDLDINIDGTVTLAGGSTIEQVKTDVNTRTQIYLDSIPFDGVGREVLYTQIATVLGTSPYILDYTLLTVNGGTVNVPLAYEEVAIVGTNDLSV